MFQVILIITALGVSLPVLIELAVFIPQATEKVGQRKGQQARVTQPESTYG